MSEGREAAAPRVPRPGKAGPSPQPHPDPQTDRAGELPAGLQQPDLLAPGLRLVFCGTALGRVSAASRARYAHPGNYFWRTLHAVGLTPRRLDPQEWRALLDWRIGLTEVSKTWFGNDADLPRIAFDVPGLRARIAAAAPGVLAFTSKTAASLALEQPTGRLRPGLQPEPWGPTRLWVLTSPSGQARRYWDETPWRALAAHVAEADAAAEAGRGGSS